MGKTKPVRYAVVDIETTGGMAQRDRITEIGIVITDGVQVLDRFESLVCPERSIPSEITRITGITTEMVADAPKFYEVARQVVEMTEGAIFVGHNVRFDYGFIKEEFARLGYTYTRRHLDTVRLTRTNFPGLRSYSLGNLIVHFGLTAERRHRALDDALATAELLHLNLLENEGQERVKDMVRLGIKETLLPGNLTVNHILDLPEEAGVYYFHDQHGELAYVGKAINIRDRVAQHFRQHTRHGEVFQKTVHDISCTVTGSELAALLLESEEIKFKHPYLNKAQRARSYPWVLHAWTDESGYRRLGVKRLTKKEKNHLQPVQAYSSLKLAEGMLGWLCEEHGLCQHLCGIYAHQPCFNYQIKKCEGACLGLESPDTYNDKVAAAITHLSVDFKDDLVILDRGRTPGEQSVVLVEDGRYKGFGYVSEEDAIAQWEDWQGYIHPRHHNPEVARIIHSFVNKGSARLKVIRRKQMAARLPASWED